MSRNKEKHINELNRLQLAKSDEHAKAKHPKRPHLSQIHTVDELRRWLPTIEREIDVTLAQTKSVRYTNEKVASMYDRISQLEREHKSFRQKIAQLEMGTNVTILTKTILIEKPIHCYTKKPVEDQQESLDEFLSKKPDLPLLATDDYRPLSSDIHPTVINNDQPLEFNTSIDKKYLVDYSDSD